MNIFKKIKQIFRVQISPEEKNFMTFWVQCEKCKEIIKVTINLKTDLINLYQEAKESAPAYKLRKEILGDDCPNLIELNVEFDSKYNILSSEVKYGKLINHALGRR
jgi:hypothetical protein